MAHELHYKKSNNLYAVYSTITGEYIIDWNSKEKVEKQWIDYVIEDSIIRTKTSIKNRMDHADEIIE